jgi:ABC-type antimicrobial peptide transport system permease subunit
MGIRLALGATVKSVVRAAAVPGMKVALFGVAAGLVLSFFATRLLASMVWGISTTDPLTLAAVAVLLVVIVAIASLIPTLRLLRLDPAQTLRSE